MKKIILLFSFYGFLAMPCIAGAQTLNNAISSFTQFPTVLYLPDNTPKKVAVKHHFHKRKKPEPIQNYKICMGNTGYFVCNEVPNDTNSTHPRLFIKVTKPNFHLDRLYNSPAGTDQQQALANAPQQQSYPVKTGDVNPSSYVILFPDKGRIRVGKVR